MAEKKVAAKAKNRASVHDFDVIIEPVITEKTMSLMQEQNKVTVRVQGKANRADVKKAFEKVFGVKVTQVNIVNVPAKETTRGGRYKGRISGFKKAVITVKEGQAIDLFKE
jgi:large subunit ribosomal protein L23